MRFSPHVTVAAIAERDGRFLMVRERIDNQIRYNQPAGHLEAGESLIEAVIRETLEETAWHYQPEAVIGLYRWVAPTNITFLRVAFSGTVTQHMPSLALDSGIETAEWLEPSAIEMLDQQLRSPLVLQCLADYQAGYRFPLSVLRELI